MTAEQLARTDDVERVVTLTLARSNALRAGGEWTAAKSELVGLLDQCPERAAEVSLALRRLAADAMGVGETAQALQILETVYQRTVPEQRSLALYGNLATACLMLGRKTAAIQYHNEALERFPDDPRRSAQEFSLALLYSDLGDDERAMELFQAVVDSTVDFAGIEQIKAVSQTSLQEIMARRAQASHSYPSSSLEAGARRGGWWIMLLIANVIVAFVVVLWQTRWSRKSPESAGPPA